MKSVTDLFMLIGIVALSACNNVINIHVSPSVALSASSPLISFAGAPGTSGTLGGLMTVSPMTIEDNGSASANVTLTMHLHV